MRYGAKPGGHTWAVLLIREVSAVIGSITLPRGGVAESGELALLESHSLHPQTEVAGAVGGRWTERGTVRQTALPWSFICSPHFTSWSDYDRRLETYCSSSRRWRRRSPPSDRTCWSWRCSLRLGTGTDRRSTAWLEKSRRAGSIRETLQCSAMRVRPVTGGEPAERAEPSLDSFIYFWLRWVK